MICSEARRLANLANAAKSTGPKTDEGKARSRRNGLKHGLSGAGVVLSESQQAEVEARVEALEADMGPKSPGGAFLIRQIALCSVRIERAAEHESAAIARNVRHAADDFDEARLEEAAALFQGLAEEPRRNLRKLKKSPEGVETLIEGWYDLLEDLTADPSEPLWTAKQMERAALMSGTRLEHARSGRIGVLSRGVWGDFARLPEADGGGLGDEARRAWCKAQLIERIEAEVASLEAHHETLDFATIERDRAEAGSRALFDASKPAVLARRYEAEATRNFFRALKEFRKVEAESLASPEPIPSPDSDSAEPSVGSSRAKLTSPAPVLDRPRFERPDAGSSTARTLESEVFPIGRPIHSPG